MPIPTRTFLNGRSTAVRLPAEFGIKPGEEVLISQERDGTLRLARAKPFAGFLAAIERMRAQGNDPANDPPLQIARDGPPRPFDLEEPKPLYRVRNRKKVR